MGETTTPPFTSMDLRHRLKDVRTMLLGLNSMRLCVSTASFARGPSSKAFAVYYGTQACKGVSESPSEILLEEGNVPSSVRTPCRLPRRTPPACLAGLAARLHARLSARRPSPALERRRPPSPPAHAASQPRLARLLRMPRQPADRTTRTPRHTGTPGTHSGCRGAQDVLRRLGAAPQIGESSKAR